jgi:voltage-gated potassium channel
MSGEELATFRTGDRGGFVRRWRALRRRTHAVLERDVDRDPLSIAVDVLLISLICISVVGIVLESMQSVYRRHAAVFDAIEVVTVVVFSVEYVLRVWVSTERRTGDEVAAGGVSRRLRYMLSPVALIDLVAIAPFYLFAFGLVPSSDLRFLRALRLLRILKLTRYSAAFETLGVVFRENLKSFTAALFVLIVVMLIAATGMYYFEHEAQPEAFSSIPAAMWWAFATLTTVGYGDITPITAAGKTFGAIISVVGIAMVALPTGILASAFTEQLRRSTERYRIESDNAWRDGVLSDDERAALEALREQLGLSEHSASQILDVERTRAMLREASAAPCCPSCGRPR